MEEGALPASRGPEDREESPGREMERGMGKEVFLPLKAHAEVLDFQ